MDAKSLTLNLTIDKSKNKVLFAESGKDFVDVLLSFLTIPLGTLVSICSKNSSVICLDNLYKSIEGLGHEYFRTTPCREMLLKPNYATELDCLDLVLNVEGDTDRKLIYYTCSPDCIHELLSQYKNTLCACGSKMVRKVKVVRKKTEKEIHEGVFLKGATRFMITDNFTVMLSSTQAVLNLLDCAGTSIDNVVEKQVKVGLVEIIAILRHSLITDDAFTNVFVRGSVNTLEKKTKAIAPISHTKAGSDCTEKVVGIKLIVDKHNNKFLYAECKQDFVDILFSFLTYPSGFVIKNLNEKSCLTCLDNLFSSALSSPISDFFKTYEMQECVVNPKLPSHFGLPDSLVKADEPVPLRYYMCRTPECDSTDVSLVPNVQCKCNRITNKRMKITDPRSRYVHGALIKQGFVTDATYVVTDDLVVTPLRSITTVLRMAENGVIEIPVSIGKNEVLALMEAVLASRAVFTDVFLVNKETSADSDVDCVLV